ncbi:hypothetical protein Mal52_46010 [Symmachiella dynata]|uniref:Methane oxygenase PmoA n=1 Tax=Symmachiella dynata TaxID=2527995 RepID=A0A517ZUF0_9PLAN|nr:PmoA family protein [Symmachiella dynata]QDU46104.1 hypothetical protein Mal52_46010 [Symmachiella dynata]
MTYKIPRVQAVPIADSQVSFQVEGTERLRWHAATRYTRPHFYPLLGPSGKPLTRMGHPAAPDHDHHKSIWFAHHKVAGLDFWGDKNNNRARQDDWVHYQDGEDEAVMVTDIGWYDGHAAKLMQQRLIAALRPLPDGETWLELQTRFTPAGNSLLLEKTNFAFLAVRMAKSISHAYGGGQLTNSSGVKGEADIFGKPAEWMDYSGPITNEITEGITYFSHPTNPHTPNSWHVRKDGWMAASVCMHNGIEITKDQPLQLRFALHAHAGDVNNERAQSLFNDFAASPPYEVIKAQPPYRVQVQRREV